jgi:pimeloyl-ACP methyl ester carboxylesterase
MRRRSLLKSVAVGAATSALMAADSRKSKVGVSNAKSREFIVAKDGTALFCRDWGAGKPMLFVAPWAMNSRWFELPIFRLTEEGVRCVAFDRRGHGRSGQPDRGYDFDTLADDLAAVMEQLDLRDVTLVGHSMGCGEVVHYLSRHAARRVARAVLIGTITPGGRPDDKSAVENVHAALTKDPHGAFAKAAADFFGAAKNPVSEETMRWWTRMIIDECNLKVALDLFRLFRTTDFRPQLSTIRVPTLLIHGDIDASALLELTAKRTAPLIPGSRLNIYENAAHGLPFTHAERLTADLLAFANG